MWPNNGFGGNGHFQGSFNQDAFQQPGFGAGPDPRFFPQQPNMLPFQVQDDSNNNGGFQPEVGIFNNGSYMQNQVVSPVSLRTLVQLLDLAKLELRDSEYAVANRFSASQSSHPRPSFHLRL